MAAVPLETVIRRLIFLQCPKASKVMQFVLLPVKPRLQAFICTVILCSFFAGPHPLPEKVDVLELFSGRARISRLAEQCGFVTRCIDVLYDQPQNKKAKKKRSCMDIAENSGFLSLSCLQTCARGHSMCFLRILIQKVDDVVDIA